MPFTKINLTAENLEELEKVCQKLNLPYVTFDPSFHLNPNDFYYPNRIPLPFWKSMSETPNVPESLIEIFSYYLDLISVSKYQILSEDFIRKHQDKVHWPLISVYQNLSEDFILEFKDRLDWFYVPQNQTLTENILTQIFTNPNLNLLMLKLNLHEVCRSQKLSENFIREFHIYFRGCWDSISTCQKLSENFIREFQDHVNWELISHNQKLSKPFIDEFQCRIAGYDQSVNFKEKSDEQKLQEIQDYAKFHNLEFDGSFLYAFRSHDNQNKGVWNKTIRYDQFGKTYRDWRCNMNENKRNSFGLGIWPKVHNLSVDVNVKVKVHYKDWGCAVKNDSNGKARVFAFTLIEKLTK